MSDATLIPFPCARAPRRRARRALDRVATISGDALLGIAWVVLGSLVVNLALIAVAVGLPAAAVVVAWLALRRARAVPPRRPPRLRLASVRPQAGASNRSKRMVKTARPCVAERSSVA